MSSGIAFSSVGYDGGAVVWDDVAGEEDSSAGVAFGFGPGAF